MKYVALTGKMGSGKSSVGHILVQNGYVPVSFAAPLKEVVIEADPLVYCGTEFDSGYERCAVGFHLSDIMADGTSFEECKRMYPEVRRSLQRIGQGVRKIDPMYWVNHCRQTLDELSRHDRPVVVTDVRYPNEAEMLRGRGFLITRIKRQSAAGGMTMDETRAALHDSETAMDSYPADLVINNDGDLNDLCRTVVDRILCA